MNAKQLRELNKDRKITQLGIVTDDYKRTIKYLTEKFQWGPWDILIDSQETSSNVHFEGEPVKEWKFYYVLTNVGDMQIELLQPISGPNPYDKFLETYGPGIHHFKEAFPEASLKERTKELEEMGNYNIYGGEDGDDLYSYFDCFKECGFYYEVGNGAIGDVDLSDLPNYVGRWPEK